MKRCEKEGKARPGPLLHRAGFAQERSKSCAGKERGLELVGYLAASARAPAQLQEAQIALQSM